MELVWLILASLVPGVLWVWFFASQDRPEKEPARLLGRTFLFGALAIIPAALLESPFRGLLDSDALLTRLAAAIVVVGLVEEAAKFGAFYFAMYRSDELDEVMDGVVYAVTAALGFAALENFLYAASFGLAVAPIRGIVTSLAHASFTGVVGYCAALMKFGVTGWQTVAWALAAAAIAHGVYDFLVLSGLISPLWTVILIFLAYRFLASKIHDAQQRAPAEE